jgi:hypothetical protein
LTHKNVRNTGETSDYSDSDRQESSDNTAAQQVLKRKSTRLTKKPKLLDEVYFTETAAASSHNNIKSPQPSASKSMI